MKNNYNINITSLSIIKVIFWLAFAYAAYLLKDFLISLLVAVVIASSFDPAVKFFRKYKVPRSVTVPVIYLLILGAIVAAFAVFAPAAAGEIAQFIQSLPKLIDQLNVFGRDLGLQDLAYYVSEFSNNVSQGQILTTFKNFFTGDSGVVHTTTVVFSNIFNFVILIVISFYLAMQEKGVENFLKIITPKSREFYVIDLWQRSQTKIGRWAQGQILLGAIVCVLIYIPLKIVGIQYAGIIATFAFVGELIPMVGLTLAMVPAFLIAFASGGIKLAGILMIIFFVVAQIENHILQPRIMNKMVGVPSLVVIISLIIGAKLAGFWGVLLAVPMASILMEFLNDLDQGRIEEEEYNKIEI
jgi:predicted PurR-regulated permease PerM